MSSTTIEQCGRLRERYYPRAEWPGLRYESTVGSAGGPDRVLLEIGCGREGRRVRRMAEHFANAIGIDMEISAQLNGTSRTRLLLGDAHHIALADRSIDVIAMANVAEHLAKPGRVMCECYRVLKPGGRLVIMTVNRRFPPIALARLLPHRVRQLANRFASGTKEEDTFPAFYRVNTAAALSSHALNAGFSIVSVEYVVHHPHYLMFSTAAYRAGIFFERLIRPIKGLRHMILGVFAKPADRTHDLSGAGSVT